jgi:hypothetical protein
MGRNAFPELIWPSGQRRKREAAVGCRFFTVLTRTCGWVAKLGEDAAFLTDAGRVALYPPSGGAKTAEGSALPCSFRRFSLSGQYRQVSRLGGPKAYMRCPTTLPPCDGAEYGRRKSCPGRR